MSRGPRRGGASKRGPKVSRLAVTNLYNTNVQRLTCTEARPEACLEASNRKDGVDKAEPNKLCLCEVIARGNIPANSADRGCQSAALRALRAQGVI